MEIDITDFFNGSEPYNFSASAAEMGQNAGRITWRNAVEEAEQSPMLTTEAQLDALRYWAKDTGAWSAEEIAAWSDAECNAFFIQLVSGDMRELQDLCMNDNGDMDWDFAQTLSEEGAIAGHIYPCDIAGHKDFGRIFYYLGN